ncbi:hypothetical protein R77591_04271 [Ralstonia mannitolilytica]|jgi:hypothetical protein|uniref:Uncharacterized protein n=1 Tax=Ralstonia mannitolilytica TaxID=105219 RepID=A0AAD2B318_9RALS|nr:hypothetical protein R77591_04271 [Ralstonia mannitolilytica]
MITLFVFILIAMLGVYSFYNFSKVLDTLALSLSNLIDSWREKNEKRNSRI